MTGSEAPEQHELSSEELDAVSGGDKATEIAQAQAAAEDKKQASALKGFQQMLQELP
jgi:hypothetical protein